MPELDHSGERWKWKLGKYKTRTLFRGFYKKSISRSEIFPRASMTGLFESKSGLRYPSIPPRSSSLSRVPRLRSNRYTSSLSSSQRSISLASTGTSLCSNCEAHLKQNTSVHTTSPHSRKHRTRSIGFPELEASSHNNLEKIPSRISYPLQRSPKKSLSETPSFEIFERDVAYQRPATFNPRKELKRAVSLPIQLATPALIHHPLKISLRALPQMSSTIVSAAAVRLATDDLFKEAEELLKKIAGEAKIIKSKVVKLNQYKFTSASSNMKRLWSAAVAVFSNS